MYGNARALDSVETENLEWCHGILESVSRTFAISIDILDEPMSTTLCAGYLLCRIADTIEDEKTLSAAKKDRLLDEFDRVLDPTTRADGDRFVRAVETVDAPATDDWELVIGSKRVIRTFEILPRPAKEAITPPVRELVEGMRLFVQRHANDDGIRIESEAELEEYCYYVAGVVGRLITNLQLWNDDLVAPPDRMRGLAESFGLLLQIVNIAKDVHADYADEGNVYLPAAWLAEVGVPPDEILADRHEEATAAVVERTARHGENYLDDAQAWLHSLPPENGAMVAACSIPFLLAIATLRELSRRPKDALSEGGVKISRGEVTTIVSTVRTDYDQSSLGSLRNSVRRGELK